MKEIIEDILEEEKKAQRRIEETRENAKKIRLQADEEAKQIMEDARNNADQAAQVIIHQAETNAQEERDRILKEETELDKELWDKKKKIIEKTIDHLFQMVIGEDVS